MPARPTVTITDGRFDPRQVTIAVGGNNFHVNSVPGTLRNSTGVGQPGSTCDHAAPQNALVFDSKAVTLSNIAADGSCFEVVVAGGGACSDRGDDAGADTRGTPGDAGAGGRGRRPGPAGGRPDPAEPGLCRV